MAKAVPSLAEWRKQLGTSTAGVIVSRLSSADQNKVFKAFVSNFEKKPDFVEASMNAVQAFQSAQATQKAATKKQQKSQASGGPGPTPTTQPATAPDAASQVQQNPAAGSLTTGPFSVGSNASSLFSSGGLDLSTPLMGTMPGTAANYPTGRYSPMPDNAKQAAAQSTPPDLMTTQSANDWLTSLYKMTPAQLSSLQADLYKSGWYDSSAVTNPKQIPFGRIDPETLKAFESAMLETARYNAAGKQLTIQQVIGRGGPSTGSQGVKSPSFQITNPVDTAAAFQNQAQQLTGGGLGDQSAFQSSFQGQEQTAYNNLASAGADRAIGLGGAYVGAPAPDTAAKAYILAHNQQDVVNYDMALRTMQFKQALAEL